MYTRMAGRSLPPTVNPMPSVAGTRYCIIWWIPTAGLRIRKVISVVSPRTTYRTSVRYENYKPDPISLLKGMENGNPENKSKNKNK